MSGGRYKDGFRDRLSVFLADEEVDQDRADAIAEEFFPANRPPVPMTESALEGLGRIQCTNSEIAAYFDISERQLLRRRADDQDVDAAIRRGQEQGRISLRRAQYQAAIGHDGKDPHPTMMIWLGKQVLGQREAGLDINLNGGLTIEGQDIRPLLERKLSEFVRSKKANGADDDEEVVH